MTNDKQEQLEYGRNRIRTWAINFGLIWILVIAWCSERWTAYGSYFLVAAALGALSAMFVAVRVARSDQQKLADSAKAPSSDNQSDDNQSESIVENRRALLRERRLAAEANSERLRMAVLERAMREYFYQETGDAARYNFMSKYWAENVNRIVGDLYLQESKMSLNQTSTSIFVGMPIQSRASEVNNESRQVTHNLKNIVGPKYTLDFGTVKVEIEGDSARINLAGAAHVIVDPPALRSESDGFENMSLGMNLSRNTLN